MRLGGVSEVDTDAGNGNRLTNGKITDVIAVSCNATAGREQACPMLREEAISAQSAKISAIGQATYTSDVYMQSMQTALDAAGYKG